MSHEPRPNQTNHVAHYIDELKPAAQAGPLPTVTPCPYCGVNMSQASHASHRPLCAQDNNMAPPPFPSVTQSSRLDQQTGGGYNADGTYPQT